MSWLWLHYVFGFSAFVGLIYSINLVASGRSRMAVVAAAVFLLAIIGYLLPENWIVYQALKWRIPDQQKVALVEWFYRPVKKSLAIYGLLGAGPWILILLPPRGKNNRQRP
ncbi:MAG: hypothetical protein M1299_00825 [Firmicutes bacterium]|nr:hypothetical protein [Bacillota bacterium]MCL5038369.1 hypothetical protein [Bacillota bacterium]